MITEMIETNSSLLIVIDQATPPRRTFQNILAQKTVSQNKGQGRAKYKECLRKALLTENNLKCKFIFLYHLTAFQINIFPEMKVAETAMSTAVSFGGTLSKHFASKSLSNLVSGPLLYLPLWCRGDFFCTTTPASFSNQRFRQHLTRWCHFHRYQNAHLLKLPR